jgi:hypothetical protein
MNAVSYSKRSLMSSFTRGARFLAGYGQRVVPALLAAGVDHIVQLGQGNADVFPDVNMAFIARFDATHALGFANLVLEHVALTIVLSGQSSDERLLQFIRDGWVDSRYHECILAALVVLEKERPLSLLGDIAALAQWVEQQDFDTEVTPRVTNPLYLSLAHYGDVAVRSSIEHHARESGTDLYGLTRGIVGNALLYIMNREPPAWNQ